MRSARSVRMDSEGERTPSTEVRRGKREREGDMRGRRTDGRQEDKTDGGGGEPEIESGSGASALGTLTSGGDMTRHAGSAQLGQCFALPCCFGSAPASLARTHTCTGAQTHTDKQIQSPPKPSPSLFSPSASYLDTHSLTPKMPRFWRAPGGQARALD